MVMRKEVAAHLRRGMAMTKRNRYGKAIRCYEKAIAADPACIEAYESKGAILGLNGQYAEALACLDMAVNLLTGVRPTAQHASIYTNRAGALDGLGRHDEALDDLETAKGLLDKTGSQASMESDLVANAFRMLGGPDRADTRGMNVEDSESALDYNRRGAFLAAEGRNSEAAECFQRATILDPKFAEAHYSRGTVMRRMGRSREALDCFDQAIKANPEYALAYHDKSVELRNMDRYEEAMECLDQSISLDPNLGLAVFGKGSLLLAMGRPKEAIPYFDRALEIDPGESIIYQEKGDALMATGDRSGALKCFRRART